MGNGPKGGLVAPSDIADLAGVTRAAVSNWRKRHNEFPQPVGGTTANPLFSRSEIEKWLELAGRPILRRGGEIGPWSLMNKFRDQLQMEQMNATLHLVLCARKLADGTPERLGLRGAARRGDFLDYLKEAATRHQADSEWHSTVLDAVVFLLRELRSQQELTAVGVFASEIFVCVDELPVSDLPDVSDHVLSRVAASEGRLAGEHGYVGSRVSNVLALCASNTTGLVYDPACGIGETLLKTWSNAGSQRIDLLGQEIDADTVLLARQRFLLRGTPASIVRADVLSEDPDPNVLADVIVAEPPLGIGMPSHFSVTDPRWGVAGPPPPKNSEVAWLQHAIAHLSAAGRGYVVTSASNAFAATTATIRRSLLREGCIEAVVGLPPKMLPNSAIPTVLWVLCRPGASRFLNSVLVIDASAMAADDDLPVKQWIAEPTALDSTAAAWTMALNTDVLADGDVSLSPRGLTESKIDPNDVIDRYRDARLQLESAPRTLQIDDLAHNPSIIVPSHVMTVRQLERQGAVSVMAGRGMGKSSLADPDDNEIDPRVVTPSMLADGLPKAQADQPLFALQRGDVTEPYDILVTTIRTIRAVVDRIGGRLPTAGVFRVQVDRTQFDPFFVAFCLAGTWNQRFEKGLYSPNANIRDLEIPLIPLANQEDIVRHVDRARRTAEEAYMIAGAAEQVAEVLLEAVRFSVEL